MWGSFTRTIKLGFHSMLKILAESVPRSMDRAMSVMSLCEQPQKTPANWLLKILTATELKATF